MSKVLHPQPRHRYWIVCAASVFILGSVGAYFLLSQAPERGATQDAVVEVVPRTVVTALGRLEPQGEVIKLSVANAADSRVNQIMVEEGDWVETDQIIAILHGLDRKQAELAEARQNAGVFEARLRQIEAGDSKIADLAAQQAVINQLEAQLRTETIERQASISRARAELQNAELNYERYQVLHGEGAIETSALDDRHERYETACAGLSEAEAHLDNTVLTLRERIREEQALLDKLREVRPVDLQVAQAELEYAIAQITRIEAELEDYYVRVPVVSQILRINTRIGEQVNINEGIVELGQTQQMYAIAEVYETDVGLVQPGQRATVVSEHGGFDGEIHGTVDHVGMQIGKQDVISADPAADRDARVVEVKVRIDPEDNDRIAGLTNLQVRITIDSLG